VSDPQPTARWLTTAAVRRIVAAVGAAGLLVVYALSGVGGLLLALTVIAAGGVLATVGRLPGPPTVRVRPRPPVPVVNAPYRTYRQVAEQLSWAQVSPRHYDVVTRPLLQRLMASRLAERHGIDVHRSPDAARALVGEDVWPWLDPGRPASGSSRRPGLAERDLHRLVERLEAL
jgi:hypothetical protein